MDSTNCRRNLDDPLARTKGPVACSSSAWRQSKQPRDPRLPSWSMIDQYYLLRDLQPLLGDVSTKQLLEEWPRAFPMLEQMVRNLSEGGLSHVIVPAGIAELLTPVIFPNKLMAVGANYSGHLKEMGLAPAKWSSMPFFLRPPTTTLVGPGKTVRLPKTTKQFDWECELAVVAGTRLQNASREQAARAIAGYAIGLDMTCRDLIQVDNDLKVDLVRGKAQDTMAPCGPHIVPAQFVSDVDNLRIQLFVNDEKMMDASTAEMLYKVDEQLSVISDYVSIEPGDIVFTGSPSGSAGVHGDRWLRSGDRIRAQIEGVGTLDVTIDD
jgi:2,4-didehydro-3-deoxy-L-rhamnonate hydrolase